MFYRLLIHRRITCSVAENKWHQVVICSWSLCDFFFLTRKTCYITLLLFDTSVSTSFNFFCIRFSATGFLRFFCSHHKGRSCNEALRRRKRSIFLISLLIRGQWHEAAWLNEEKHRVPITARANSLCLMSKCLTPPVESMATRLLWSRCQNSGFWGTCLSHRALEISCTEVKWKLVQPLSLLLLKSWVFIGIKSFSDSFYWVWKQYKEHWYV